MPEPLTMIVGGFLVNQVGSVFSSMVSGAAASQVNGRLAKAFRQPAENHDIQKALREAWREACAGAFAIYRDSPGFGRLPSEQQELVNERERWFVEPGTVDVLFGDPGTALREDDVVRMFTTDRGEVNRQLVAALDEHGLWDGLPGGLQSILQGRLLDALTFHFVEVAVKQTPQARDALFFEQFIALRHAAGESQAEQERLWAEVTNRLSDLDGYQRWQQDVLVFVRDTTGRTETKVDAVSEKLDDLVAFLRENLDKAVSKQTVSVSVGERNQVARRASRLEPILRGAQVLWVDDVPDNNVYERQILAGLGISVDCVTTTAEALDKLTTSGTNYDVVISDIGRPRDLWTEGPSEAPDRPAGRRFLDALVKRRLRKPVVFYAWPVSEDQGVPPYAFGITERPDELMHLVMDALERTRG